MPRDPPTFLTLPLELRLEIYSHLLVLPPPPPRESLRPIYRCSFAASRALGSPTGTNSKPTLHPQILRVNKQTYHEALPILYGQNTFSAHPVQFTARPTLYHPYCSPCRPVTTVTPVGVEYDHPKSSSSTHAPGAEGRKEGENEAGRGKRTALALTNPNIRLIRKWHLRVRLDGPASPAPGVPAAATPAHSPEEQGGDDASPASMSLPSIATASAIATGDDTIPTSSNRSKPATQPEGPPGPPYSNPIAAAFSNAESLTLDLWRGGFTTSGHGAATAATGGGGGDDEGGGEEVGGPAALRPFEDVRGVRRVRIVGATAGIEEYLGWLQERMTVPTTTATKVSG
ncbi:hypothetical protein MYCTH_2300594 [Thermothelomyces thermophilus ATCC 42464]|uniref:F-box domain-containing protein n=1 Tax=Thermothelomyces thermophilus (strain ATCC 42464 / BCRC 31852 / DSM 1799) TaxID=573729 RepID=G2Q7N1_THET4|nr:uncharacterized protein MYCTH_2300594 [Thermothelomyces thermophilus ATCC 42464]AEO56089.1 hypothetical protein MYCTH_2300594 [Thermothelomyces thermophilus ATCC 42464]